MVPDPAVGDAHSASTELVTMSPSTADKFFHLVYEYRYLALAGRAWRHFGPNGNSTEQRSANALQPGIGVLIQDSLLAHARLLIDFYTSPRQAIQTSSSVTFGSRASAPHCTRV